jgi:hypothetical protein
MTDLNERGTMAEQDFDEWVAALETERYRQGHTALQDGTGGYCCLGVRCVLAGVDLEEVAEHFGVDPAFGSSPMPLSDFGGTKDYEIRDTPLGPVLGQIPEWARCDLANFNDGIEADSNPEGREFSFPEIAEWLIANKDYIVAGGE